MILVAQLTLKPLIEIKRLTSSTGEAQGSRVSTAESSQGWAGFLCFIAKYLGFHPR